MAMVAALALAGLAIGGAQSSSDTLVRGGEDLQGALDRAQPGDVLRLEAGATFEGNFRLPAKQGDRPITIRSTAPDRQLPGANERIGLNHARFVPTIKSPNAQPALRTEARASHWHLVTVQIVGGGEGDVVLLGDGSRAQSSYDVVPEDLVLDRVIVRGNPNGTQKRGIALNSAATTIKNSYIDDIKAEGLETQGIAGWNGPGPYLIENNFLQAAGINILFGGAEPSIGGLVPSDIVFRRNLVTKDLDWRGGRWTVKNLFELKNARRVQVEANRFERNWSAAQTGYAILFTVRNPGGRATWSTVEDVTFRNNLVRGVAAGINVLGYDTNARTQQVRNILIQNNLFDDVSEESWGGSGTFLQLGDEPADITVEQNTILQSGNVVTVYGGTRASPRPIRGFRFINNIAFHNSYGIFGSGAGYGMAAIERYLPEAEIRGNILAGGNAGRYPEGNMFPSVDDLVGSFMDYRGRDYRLKVSTQFRAGADGQPVGVDIQALTQAIGDPRR